MGREYSDGHASAGVLTFRIPTLKSKRREPAMAATGTKSIGERPNFLVIMTDQQRGDCLSAAGHPVLMTPNMDAIGGNGVRFRRAYSTCPVCVPARHSFLSGQFPSIHGVLNNASVEWDATHTLPTVLRDAGYQTEWVGRGMHQTPPLKRYGSTTADTAMPRLSGKSVPGRAGQWSGRRRSRRTADTGTGHCVLSRPITELPDNININITF